MTSPPNQRPLDEFDLEVELAGGDLGPDWSTQLRADPTFDPARAEIERVRTWWMRNAPPLRSPRRRLSRIWVALPLALAAGLAFVVLNVGSPDFASRGSVNVDLQATRADRPVDRAEGLRARDELAIRLVPEQSVYVTVGTIQADGVVSVLVIGEPAGPDRPFRSDFRVLLDDYGGREWLVVWTTDRPPPDASSVVAAYRDLLPSPGLAAPDRSDLAVFEITRQSAGR